MTSSKNLTVINYQGCRVLTMKQLSEVYNVPSSALRHRYEKNKGNFKKGEDYYFLEGEALQEFKRKQTLEIYNSLVYKMTTKLFLWTARGTRKLSKRIPKEKYTKLKKSYFDIPKKPLKVYEKEEITLIINTESEVLVSSRNVASRLGRRHTKVLTDIRKLLTNNEEEIVKNFNKQAFKVPKCPITFTEYLMTQSGLLLLTSRYRSSNVKTVLDEYSQAFKLDCKEILRINNIA